uniref:Secreted protein n=1 Tax=Mesocestoides corti TaxID=53468 RepID=A0A5K3FLH3_MESCO
MVPGVHKCAPAVLNANACAGTTRTLYCCAHAHTRSCHNTCSGGAWGLRSNLSPWPISSCPCSGPLDGRYGLPVGPHRRTHSLAPLMYDRDVLGTARVPESCGNCSQIGLK